MEDWEFLGLDAPTHITGSGHLVWGGMPIELEMAVLLYAVVRYAKPRLVVESGAGSGRSSVAIARAICANGAGRLVTFEPDPEFRGPLERVFAKAEFVEVRDGLARESGLEPDLVFVDTGGGPECRQPEIDHWVGHPGKPIVIVHDGNRGYGLGGRPGVNLVGHDGVWIGQER